MSFGRSLEATDISVRFGGLRAVSNVDLQVAGAEIVAIVGPNGAGKTTLLNAISGFVRMRGSVSVNGRTPKSIHPRAMAGLGLARSFQTPQLIEHEDALQNVACGAHLRAGYSAWDQVFRRRRTNGLERHLMDEARDCLQHAGIGEADMVRPVAQLTHGMRKRIDIARAMMSRPVLLVMDEPTAGMGPEERELVRAMALELRQRHGTAVLMVEHHMDVVRAMADRVVAMQTGSVLVVGHPEEVLASHEFVVASLGRAATQSMVDEESEAPLAGRSR